MIKKLIIVVLLMLCVTGLLLGMYTSENVSISIDGITYKLSDENYENKTHIVVKGKISKNRLGSKKFNGDIYINDIELKDLELNLDKTNTADFEECKKINLRGRFYIDKNFKNVLLYLYGGQLGNTEIVNHMIIAGPAANRKEAFQLTKDLSSGE